MPEIQTPNTKHRFKRKNIVILAAVLAAAILLLISLFTGGWHKPVDNIFKSISNGDESVYKKSMPDCQVNYYSSMIKDYDDYKTVDDFIKYRLNYIIKKLEKTYGSDIKANYSVNSKNELDSEQLESIKSDLCNQYGCKELDVSKGYTLEINAEFAGSEKSDRKTMKIQVAKIDGKWCAVNDLPIE